MTTQELLDFIQNSPLSAETKAAAKVMLGGYDVVTLELQGKIKELIQSELDADFDTAGIMLPDSAEVQAAEKEFSDDAAAVDASLDADMTFVQTQIDELDALKKQVDKTLDEMEADQIKKDLASA
ncbi:MAG: hypothetical protein KBC98_00210 [Candidatus Pacebacteria bacterium]|nr:hypothetical protein [Candidatus Paceibacterota bacterium]